MLDSSGKNYLIDRNGFDDMWENGPQIARETGSVNWDSVNPNDLVAIVAGLATHAMNNTSDKGHIESEIMPLGFIDTSVLGGGIR